MLLLPRLAQELQAKQILQVLEIFALQRMLHPRLAFLGRIRTMMIETTNVEEAELEVFTADATLKRTKKIGAIGHAARLTARITRDDHVRDGRTEEIKPMVKRAGATIGKKVVGDTGKAKEGGNLTNPGSGAKQGQKDWKTVPKATVDRRAGVVIIVQAQAPIQNGTQDQNKIQSGWTLQSQKARNKLTQRKIFRNGKNV